MRTAFLLAAGSRGDTEPFFSLSMALITEGAFDHIHLCMQAEYTSLIPKHPQITAHFIPFKTTTIMFYMLYEFLKDGLLSLFTGKFDPLKAQNRGLGNLQYYCIPRFYSFLRTLIDDLRPDVIVSTSVFSFTALTLARHHAVPFAAVHFQPVHPTTMYPYMVADLPTSLQAAIDIAKLHWTEAPVRKSEYLLSYDKALQCYLGAVLPIKLNDFREELGLRRLRLDEVDSERYSHDEKILSLYAYPIELVPRDPCWGANVHVVNSVSDEYVPPGWTPEQKCPKTLEYLRKSTQPFLVTFGSMSVPGCAAWTSRQMLQGLRDANVENVLLLKGCANLGAHNLSSYQDRDLIEWAAENVFFTDESPQYSWLMPQCRAVLCHGGSGTVCASLRAGLPTMVAPVAADQYFWGRLIAEMQLGATVEPCLRKADANAYVKAIAIGMEDEVAERLNKLSQQIRCRPGGASNASKLIAKLVT